MSIPSSFSANESQLRATLNVPAPMVLPVSSYLRVLILQMDHNNIVKNQKHSIQITSFHRNNGSQGQLTSLHWARAQISLIKPKQERVIQNILKAQSKENTITILLSEGTKKVLKAIKLLPFFCLFLRGGGKPSGTQGLHLALCLGVIHDGNTLEIYLCSAENQTQGCTCAISLVPITIFKQPICPVKYSMYKNIIYQCVFSAAGMQSSNIQNDLKSPTTLSIVLRTLLS